MQEFHENNEIFPPRRLNYEKKAGKYDEIIRENILKFLPFESSIVFCFFARLTSMTFFFSAVAADNKFHSFNLFVIKLDEIDMA